MHVSGPPLQDFVRMMPWWVAFGYNADNDTWLPGGDNSYYTLFPTQAPDPSMCMADSEEYAAQANKILNELKKVIVGVTRDWKQPGQIWCWACEGP